MTQITVKLFNIWFLWPIIPDTLEQKLSWEENRNKNAIQDLVIFIQSAVVKFFPIRESFKYIQYPNKWT